MIQAKAESERLVRTLSITLWAVLALVNPAAAGGRYYKVDYPPSDKPGELHIGVTYTLWVPEAVSRLRGVIVHQHGCGAGACKGGATAAYDLHWQALAQKWDCALLGPSYHQADNQDCRLWCDPRKGSAKVFLQALHDLGKQAQHPELEAIPWCLWGHSGGGFWASLMQTLYPERIVAIWLRSGTAFSAWEQGRIARPTIPDEAYRIPVFCNPGGEEKGDQRFHGAWTGSLEMFKAYRAHGAPIGFAPDPRTSHECGDCRYLAIAFFDACLAMRLPTSLLPKEAVSPGVPGQQVPLATTSERKLRPVDDQQAWLGELLGSRAEPAAHVPGKRSESVWLPNARVAQAWMEYVKTGTVSAVTPPPPPFDVAVRRRSEQETEITWDAVADLESGLQAFVIERDGKEIARVPEKPLTSLGRPLFQGLSYHDTPVQPLPPMRFLDRTAGGTAKHDYRVLAVNSAGRKSAPAAPLRTDKLPNFASWEEEIRAFERKDQDKPPPRNAIVFVGSSSIRLWKLDQSFADLATLNRGFGGSQLADSVHFAPRLVLKYEPGLVVLYAGDNDIGSGKTPGQVAADFRDFVQTIHAVRPQTRIVFLSIKPSILRWGLWNRMRQVNAQIEALCWQDERLRYVDMAGPMLDADGKLRAGLFRADGLHLNDKGYALWATILRPHLR